MSKPVRCGGGDCWSSTTSRCGRSAWKLERWYGVEIDTSSPTLDGVLYTGMIKRHATLNTIADLMNLTNDVVFTEDGGVIRVVRKSE
ncbi:MAG: DUF4974 domain-containing protein [Alistipes senegalensis]